MSKAPGSGVWPSDQSIRHDHLLRHPAALPMLSRQNDFVVENLTMAGCRFGSLRPKHARPLFRGHNDRQQPLWRRMEEHPMIVRNVMSQTCLSLSLWSTVREAAALMRDKGVAALPVKCGGLPMGLVVDREIVVGLLSEARDAGAQSVSNAMIRHPVSCFADHDVTEAAVMMGEEQVRHLLVTDRSGGLVGVLSVDDIAENASEELAGQVLGEIVEKRASPACWACVRRPRRSRCAAR